MAATRELVRRRPIEPVVEPGLRGLLRIIVAILVAVLPIPALNGALVRAGLSKNAAEHGANSISVAVLALIAIVAYLRWRAQAIGIVSFSDSSLLVGASRQTLRRSGLRLTSTGA